MLGLFGPLGLALGLGAVMAQGLAPTNLVFAAPVALVGIAFLFLRETTCARAWWLGWCFGAGYFATGLSWIVEPFQIDAATYGWMAPFALVLLAGGLALFWGAAFCVAQRVSHGNWRILALIGAWSLVEFLRAYALTGFPWGALGQLAVGDLTLRLLPWIGPQGVALAKLLVFLPLPLVLQQKWWALLPSGTAVAIVFTVLPPLPKPADVATTDHLVRLVQPNAPQDEKWDPDKRWDFVRRQVGYSAIAPKPDLIVWPETAVPQLLNYATDTLGVISQSANGAPILMGIQREEDGKYFNSAVLLDAAGTPQETYDKVHLVPFGEYMPFPDLVARFGIYGLAARANSGYTAGANQPVLSSPVGRFLPLICYEGVFPHEVPTVADRPDFLALLTNDAWFGTYSGPQQHLVQAQMRAAEQGLPMVRVANTGVSAMIDPFGRIVPNALIPLGQAGYVDAQLPAPLPATLYAHTGDWPWLGFCVFFLGIPAFSHIYVARRKQAVKVSSL
ncbi:apolipoprotein N-acyltransferase [Epibacterium ulvae]|uniref:apolipoprotein N-acyltransferase n=1 Tax=Epibacterium ulvae TaxID=1156985 RepID=UPI001BFC4814|nr:apolipoprotein N-acyltransferase [Epibacterium ulvae]MBT8153967.1 apolipoprotein N-acyltransferase [Epibacterium ulvae]